MKPFLKVILIFILFSCTKDNYLRLPASDFITDFIPDYTTSKQFRSNTNDTITLELISRTQVFDKISEGLVNGGSLPDFDYLEVERITQIIGSEEHDYRFTFTATSNYNPDVITRSEDNLDIKFEEAGIEVAEMQFFYKDSLECISQRCLFVDTTIKLQFRNFDDLYFTRRDSISRNAIFINSTNGLVGFKTSDNKIYELIP